MVDREQDVLRSGMASEKEVPVVRREGRLGVQTWETGRQGLPFFLEDGEESDASKRTYALEVGDRLGILNQEKSALITEVEIIMSMGNLTWREIKDAMVPVGANWLKVQVILDAFTLQSPGYLSTRHGPLSSEQVDSQTPQA